MACFAAWCARVAATKADGKRGDYEASDAPIDPGDGLDLETAREQWLNGMVGDREIPWQGYVDWLKPARRRPGMQALTATDLEDVPTWMLTEGGKRGQGLAAATVVKTLNAVSQVLDRALGDEHGHSWIFGERTGTSRFASDMGELR